MNDQMGWRRLARELKISRVNWRRTDQAEFHQSELRDFDQFQPRAQR
jgi:hypothetical protein